MLGFFTVRIMAYICVGLGIVIAILGFRIWAQGVELGHMENQLAKANIELGKAKESIKGFQDAVRQCNLATKALEQASAEKSAAADKALLQAQQEARRYADANKRRAVLLASPTPAGAGCREALVDLRRGLK